MIEVPRMLWQHRRDPNIAWGEEVERQQKGSRCDTWTEIQNASRHKESRRENYMEGGHWILGRTQEQRQHCV